MSMLSQVMVLLSLSLSLSHSLSNNECKKKTDQICKAMVTHIKKKFKTQTVKPSHVKNNLCVFINCLLNNPRFDSQIKVGPFLFFLSSHSS